MSHETASVEASSFHPVTLERWADLESLFGERGACAGCWCMWWRLNRSEWERGRGEGNRAALQGLVETGQVPGILAYAGDRPVGWCSVGPREAYPSLERSRTLKRVDAEPVWSVVCFFVDRAFRQQGITARLLRAAVDHVRAQGGTLVEGYPVLPGRRIADAWAYTGLASTFLQAGFVEVARPSETRLIVRKRLLLSSSQ